MSQIANKYFDEQQVFPRLRFWCSIVMLTGGSLLWFISIVRLFSDVVAHQQIAGVKSQTERLLLQGTLVSPSQRVAIINRQLCREGQQILINNVKYRLHKVADKQIVLSHNSRQMALQLTHVKTGNLR